MAGFWMEVYIDPDQLTPEEWLTLSTLIEKATVKDADK